MCNIARFIWKLSIETKKNCFLYILPDAKKNGGTRCGSAVQADSYELQFFVDQVLVIAPFDFFAGIFCAFINSFDRVADGFGNLSIDGLGIKLGRNHQLRFLRGLGFRGKKPAESRQFSQERHSGYAADHGFLVDAADDKTIALVANHNFSINLIIIGNTRIAVGLPADQAAVVDFHREVGRILADLRLYGHNESERAAGQSVDDRPFGNINIVYPRLRHPGRIIRTGNRIKYADILIQRKVIGGGLKPEVAGRIKVSTD